MVYTECVIYNYIYIYIFLSYFLWFAFNSFFIYVYLYICNSTRALNSKIRFHAIHSLEFIGWNFNLVNIHLRVTISNNYAKISVIEKYLSFRLNHFRIFVFFDQHSMLLFARELWLQINLYYTFHYLFCSVRWNPILNEKRKNRLQTSNIQFKK